ncbi:MAG: fibronectin type III domain-containing protein [Oscillochloridaceae bacterium umkhey_bin13]
MWSIARSLRFVMFATLLLLGGLLLIGPAHTMIAADPSSRWIGQAAGPTFNCNPNADGLLSATTSTSGMAYGLAVQGNYAYVGDWNSAQGAGILHIFDVSDPCLPSQRSAIAANNPASHELGDLVVVNGNAYLANDGNGVAIYDVSQPSNPFFVAAKPSSSFGYTNAIFYSGGPYLYSGQLYAPNQAFATHQMAFFMSRAPSYYTPPNLDYTRDAHNIQVDSGRGYVLFGDGEGANFLEILDLTTPLTPTLLGRFNLPYETYGNNGDLRVRDGYVYIATSATATPTGRLVVVDARTPNAPTLAASLALPNAAAVPWRGASLTLDGNYAYVVGRSSLYSINITNPASPTLERTRALPANFGSVLGGRVSVQNGLAYVTVYRNESVADSQGGLAIYTLGETPALSYRDVGELRVWADSFVTSGSQTTASGNLGLGPRTATAPIYRVGTTISWGSSGALTLSGGIGFVGEALFASGGASVDRTSGALTWQSGSQATLLKLGASELAISAATLTVNLRQTTVQVSAVINLSLPGNPGTTATVSYTLGKGGAISGGQPVNLQLNLAGGELRATIRATSQGLLADSTQYLLPGLATINLPSLLIDGKATTRMRFGSESSFALPNLDLGNGVIQLSNLRGTLSVSGDAYVIDLTGNLSLHNLPETSQPIQPTITNLRIAQGSVGGSISAISLSANGAPFMQLSNLSLQRNAAGYRLAAGSAVWYWPAAWGGGSTTIPAVAITTSAPFLSIGTNQRFTTTSSFTLGEGTATRMRFDQISGQLGYQTNPARWSMELTTRLIFVFGNEPTVINGVSLRVSGGRVSGSIASQQLNLAGFILTTGPMHYQEDVFTSSQASLSLPSDWGGGSVNVGELRISSVGVRLGGAGASFPLADRSFGQSFKLSGLVGTVQIDGNGRYLISVNGTVSFTAGTSPPTSTPISFTLANGAASATLGRVNLKIAGLDVVAEQLSYAAGTFRAASAVITLPSIWQSLPVQVNELSIDGSRFRFGSAGTSFPIPDMTLGAAGVLAMTGMRGSLEMATNGDYQISINATITVNKVQSSSGGTLSLAGRLAIQGGRIDGSVSNVAFNMSGVDFRAASMTFVDDRLSAEQMTLSLAIGGRSLTATVYGIELGGGAGFRMQGARVALPDFAIGTVGVQGATIEFQRLNNGDFQVAGAAKFVFTQFKVDGSFKLAYTPGSGASLKAVSINFESTSSALQIPLGTTGFAIYKISAAFDLSDGSTIISMRIGAATMMSVGTAPVLSIDGEITLQIKPRFQLDAYANAKLIGIEVASVHLQITESSFSLKGQIQVAIVKASLELTFGLDAQRQFTFYGAVQADVVVPRGYVCAGSWWCFGKYIPKSNTNIGSAKLDGGKFRKDNNIIWGARGSTEAFGLKIYVWAKFAPGGTEFGLGDRLQSYTPVKPAGVNAAEFAANADPYRITVGAPAEYLIVVESIGDGNRNQPEEIQINGPSGAQFTRTLVYTERDESDPLSPVAIARLYRLDFVNPADAVGQWMIDVRQGNMVALLGATLAPQISQLAACTSADNCLHPDTAVELTNNQPLTLSWTANVSQPDLALQIFAEDANGQRFPVVGQATTSAGQLDGTLNWMLALSSGSYTLTAQVESDGFAPEQHTAGRFIINDTTAPTLPSDLTATTDGGSIATVSWDATVAEADVAGYQITVDAGDTITVNGPINQHIVYGLIPGATHTIKVAAYDLSNNLGPAATVTVGVPQLGVTAAWPRHTGQVSAISEVGASFNGPITLLGLVVTTADGNPVAGSVTPLTGELSITQTVTLGANFAPDSGILSPGMYQATITARNPQDGTDLVYRWNFTALEAPRQPVYLPLVRR